MPGTRFRIGAFSYDFPHYRTQMGLFKLAFEEILPDVVLAQGRKNLSFYQSQIRFSPDYIDVPHTRDIARFHGIDYVVGDHDSAAIVEEVKRRKLDVGVILGARILKADIINAFRVGVINLHPGIIPLNRGLDNLKWAVEDRIPQAVTSHLIDPQIDMGRVIDLQLVDVKPDDTLIDVHIRQQETMHRMTVEAIRLLEEGVIPRPMMDEGTYHHAISPDKEQGLWQKFDAYKREYPQIVRAWEESGRRDGIVPEAVAVLAGRAS